MVVKTFRGLLADGGQDRIRLQTIKGKVGYKVIKFQGFPNLPATVDQESLLLIWKKEQTSVPTSAPSVNFTDSDLLAALYYVGMSGTYGYSADLVIFDNEIFNQDIYITHTEGVAAFNFNYYIELEVIPLDDAGAEYTTLKDMRST